MRRTFTLLLALACMAGIAPAQVRTGAPPIPSGHEGAPNPYSLARTEAPLVVNPLSLGPGCTNVDSLSASSNLFSLILTESNPIAVDNATNTMVFAHRQNATTFGGHSGMIRYDVSTNGGQTWTANQGPVNPLSVNGTNGARYPNVAIYNPAGNTDPNNAYLAYMAPTTGATWNGHVSGVRRLNGSGNTENYNQAVATQTLIPRGLVNGAPGVFWSIDAVYNGTIITGFRVLKGTWNGSNDVVWAVNTTLTPTWNTAYDGNPHNSDFSIAFDPTGTIGWVCFLGHVSPGPASFAYCPVFYRTVDGGQNWTGPMQVDLASYPCISSNILSGNTTTTAFDLDLTVDALGNPHALMPVGNGDNAYAIYFGSWHAMVDVTMDHGMWNPKIIRDVFRGRGTWGTAPNAVSMDMESQVSRSSDGSKVFFLWGDGDSLNINANQQPNLYGAAYNVLTRNWTAVKNFTVCHPVFNGRALFPKAAPTTRSVANGDQVPVVIGRLLGAAQDPLLVSSFHFVDSVYFYNSDYVTPQCMQSVSLAPNDTLAACGSTTLNAGTAQLYAWNTGASTQTITVTSSGWYRVVVSNNCCVGWDSVYVNLTPNPVAGFSSSANSLAVTFTNTSTGSPTAYSWNFGDGSPVSTQVSPSYTYTLPGTYNVCLSATNSCTTQTVCQNVTVSCAPVPAQFSFTSNGLMANFTNLTGGNPSVYSWAFGDGNFSSLENPSHTFAAQGTYTVCLAITDSCGSDTVCQFVTVGCTPPSASFSSVVSGLNVAYSDQSTGTPTSWLWSFGDGNQSTAQNPNHVYSFAGSYLVCLTVTDACGSDSMCATVTTCAPPVAGFSFNTGAGGSASFTDQSTNAVSSWAWDFGDGGTSTAQNPSHVYTATGTYTVCLIATNSCSTDTTCQTVTITTVGVDERLEGMFVLVPNPASTMVELRAADLTWGPVGMRIYNVLGQTLLVRNAIHGGGEFVEALDLSGWGKGVYFVEVALEGKRFTKKLVLR